jgi:hypothetical protein
VVLLKADSLLLGPRLAGQVHPVQMRVNVNTKAQWKKAFSEHKFVCSLEL